VIVGDANKCEKNVAFVGHERRRGGHAPRRRKYNATAAQINLAWLLHRSAIILPIPGTSSLAHFNENNKATAITLTQEDMEYLG
jgi:aryl-alcohol dehydrogenase-like predicted oxidoreductase